TSAARRTRCRKRPTGTSPRSKSCCSRRKPSYCRGRGRAGQAHQSLTRAGPALGPRPGPLPEAKVVNGGGGARRTEPRSPGHKRGVGAVRARVRACVERGIESLTLFASSCETWRGPAEEVALLMQLFQGALLNEMERLNRNGVRLRIVGDTRRFDVSIRRLID